MKTERNISSEALQMFYQTESLQLLLCTLAHRIHIELNRSVTPIHHQCWAWAVSNHLWALVTWNTVRHTLFSPLLLADCVLTVGGGAFLQLVLTHCKDLTTADLDGDKVHIRFLSKRSKITLLIFFVVVWKCDSVFKKISEMFPSKVKMRCL